MKGLITIALAAILCGCASMPKEQRTYEIAYQALHAIDTAQTLKINNVAGRETNPILGRHPKDYEVIAYMAAEAAIHARISKAMADHDAPMWMQRSWHYVSLIWNGHLVIRNERRGY